MFASKLERRLTCYDMETLDTVLYRSGAYNASRTDLTRLVMVFSTTSLYIVVRDAEHANFVAFGSTSLIEVKSMFLVSFMARKDGLFSTRNLSKNFVCKNFNGIQIVTSKPTVMCDVQTSKFC